MPAGAVSIGLRCLDCGTEFRLTQLHDGRNPWHAINAGQSQCNRCFTSTTGKLSSPTVPERVTSVLALTGAAGFGNAELEAADAAPRAVAANEGPDRESVEDGPAQ